MSTDQTLASDTDSSLKPRQDPQVVAGDQPPACETQRSSGDDVMEHTHRHSRTHANVTDTQRQERGKGENPSLKLKHIFSLLLLQSSVLQLSQMYI